MSHLVDRLIWQIHAAKLPKPIQEFQFAKHLKRRWRFDLCWPHERLALEVEGGLWIRGRHSRGRGMIADMEKYNAATLMGYRVLRVSGDHIDSGKALDWIEEGLREAA